MEKEKRYDVVALGELLIDFTQSGYSSQGNRRGALRVMPEREEILKCISK